MLVEIVPILIKGSIPTAATTTTTTTTKQNVNPAVYFVYSRVKMHFRPCFSIATVAAFTFYDIKCHTFLMSFVASSFIQQEFGYFLSYVNICSKYGNRDRFIETDIAFLQVSLSPEQSTLVKTNSPASATTFEQSPQTALVATLDTYHFFVYRFFLPLWIHPYYPGAGNFRAVTCVPCWLQF
jgi:hypothetical protein